MTPGFSSAALFVIVFAATTTHAHAYIDPVTGSFLIQGIAAAFAGAMVAFRSVRQKVFALVGVKSRRSDAPADTSAHDS